MDPGWLAAMRRRGLSDAETAFTQIDPFSLGYFGRDFERGRRIVRAVSYFRAKRIDNAYTRPIEGVGAMVDLIAEKVIDLVDDERIIPVPRKIRNDAAEDNATPRTACKPEDSRGCRWNMLAHAQTRRLFRRVARFEARGRSWQRSAWLL